MDQNLAQKAISCALLGKWENACKINKLIIKDYPDDVDALNRLARSYAELGEIPKAKTYAKKVLRIDPFNTIASKSLSKWKALKKGDSDSSSVSDPALFLEESGKTKIVSLLHLGSEKIISRLNAGDMVHLNTHGHRVSVNSNSGKYIGKFSDDLSSLIKKLVKLGYKYQIIIKSSDSQGVKILIKEIQRPDKFSDKPSFVSEKINYISFTPPELVHKKDLTYDEIEDVE